MVTKICVLNYVGDIYHQAKFYPNRFRGFGFAHALLRAPRHKITRLFFWVFEKGYSRDARTDFDAKYVKRRGSEQRNAFLEVAKPKSKASTPIFHPQTAIFGPNF